MRLLLILSSVWNKYIHSICVCVCFLFFFFQADLSEGDSSAVSYL